MMKNAVLTTFSLLLFTFAAARTFKSQNDTNNYLQNVYEKNSNLRCSRLKTAQWIFETDPSDSNKEAIFRNLSLTQAEGIRKEWAENFKNLTPKKGWSGKIKRQISFAEKIGPHALETNDFKNLTNIIKNMTITFKSANICPYNKKKCKKSDMLSLEPDLEMRMQKSENTAELLYIWTSWRDLINGNGIKKQFSQYVALSNKAAKLNGFKDTGHMWRSEYESSSFFDKVDYLWEDVKPLYNELHKYALKKLRKFYQGQFDFDDGLIPAHILGDMWGRDWTRLSSILKPYPKSHSINVTEELVNENYYVVDMFRAANSFYTSMGLLTNEMGYDSAAMIQKPADRNVSCQAGNFDFCDGRHYRMKRCSNLAQADFLDIHSQMAEVQYFQQYKGQPYSFRGFANPAFGRAVGGAVGLAASTPSYLERIGLVNDFKNTYGTAMNRLMDMALRDVASLPYDLLVDKWRWGVFSGSDDDRWNLVWWKNREYYQKVKPPVPRSKDKFDPGAQFHLVDGQHSIDYYVATILKYQIYQGLCLKSGQYDPKRKSSILNRCDFSRSREAGDALRSGLQLGKSKHWKEVLKIITDADDFDAAPLLEFYGPLYDYLRYSNQIQKPTTKKPRKKKKKKPGKNKKMNRQRTFPFESLDFDEDSFEGDDEDFQDDSEETNDEVDDSLGHWTLDGSSNDRTTDEDVFNVTEAIEFVNNSLITPSTEAIRILKPPVVNSTEGNLDEDAYEFTNWTKHVEDHTSEETTTNPTLAEFSTTQKKSTAEPGTFKTTTSPGTTEEAADAPSFESTTRDNSIDIVFRRNISTIPSVQVEVVTVAEVATRKLENSVGVKVSNVDLKLFALFVLLVLV